MCACVSAVCDYVLKVGTQNKKGNNIRPKFGLSRIVLCFLVFGERLSKMKCGMIRMGPGWKTVSAKLDVQQDVKDPMV